MERENAIYKLIPYGSARRQFRGKKSESIQFGPEGIEELRRLIQDEKLTQEVR
jgi:hypothetical protein